jgi:UDP-N-acetylmuramoyl-tripeptide--D-alanyl-D-alanine ligase
MLSGIHNSNDTSVLFDDGNKLKCKIFRYGTTPDADYRAEDIKFENGYNTYIYVHNDQRIQVNLHQLGKHNVLNSLVSMAIADYMGLDLMKAASHFETFVGMRQKILVSEKDYTIIDDTYNASPDSMKAAINILGDINSSGRKIAVLGDMFELGSDSDKYHQEVGQYLRDKYNNDNNYLDELICIGESSLKISAEVKDTKIKINNFDNNKSAAEYLNETLSPGDVIILKASNGMHFSEIVNSIK